MASLYWVTLTNSNILLKTTHLCYCSFYYLIRNEAFFNPTSGPYHLPRSHINCHCDSPNISISWTFSIIGIHFGSPCVLWYLPGKFLRPRRPQTNSGPLACYTHTPCSSFQVSFCSTIWKQWKATHLGKPQTATHGMPLKTAGGLCISQQLLVSRFCSFRHPPATTPFYSQFCFRSMQQANFSLEGGCSNVECCLHRGKTDTLKGRLLEATVEWPKSL